MTNKLELVNEENPFLTDKIVRKQNTKDARILFLYPNERGMSTIPPSIAGLSQILKDEGHVTSLFDTTFYKFDDEISIEDSDKIRSDVLETRPVLDRDDDDLHFKKTTRSAIDDFRKAIIEFKPDVVCGYVHPDWYELIEKVSSKKIKIYSLLIDHNGPGFIVNSNNWMKEILPDIYLRLNDRKIITQPKPYNATFIF